MSEINAVEQVQNALGSMYLSRKDIQRLREILQVRENRLDTNRKSFLSEEEEKHLHKCTENRADGKIVCPNCGSIAVVRNGTPRGRQRYFCKDCKKTFGDTFGTVIHDTKTLYRIVTSNYSATLEGSVFLGKEPIIPEAEAPIDNLTIIELMRAEAAANGGRISVDIAPRGVCLSETDLDSAA